MPYMWNTRRRKCHRIVLYDNATMFKVTLNIGCQFWERLIDFLKKNVGAWPSHRISNKYADDQKPTQSCQDSCIYDLPVYQNVCLGFYQRNPFFKYMCVALWNKLKYIWKINCTSKVMAPYTSILVWSFTTLRLGHGSRLRYASVITYMQLVVCNYPSIT